MKKLTGTLSEPSVVLLNKILDAATIKFSDSSAATMLMAELRAFVPVEETPSAPVDPPK